MQGKSQIYMESIGYFFYNIFERKEQVANKCPYYKSILPSVTEKDDY